MPWLALIQGLLQAKQQQSQAKEAKAAAGSPAHLGGSGGGMTPQPQAQPAQAQPKYPALDQLQRPPARDDEYKALSV